MLTIFQKNRLKPIQKAMFGSLVTSLGREAGAMIKRFRVQAWLESLLGNYLLQNTFQKNKSKAAQKTLCFGLDSSLR